MTRKYKIQNIKFLNYPTLSKLNQIKSNLT